VRVRARAAALVLGAALIAASGSGLAACGGDSDSDSAQALRTYLKAVQPIRLGVNDLLEGADPILEGYRDGTLTGQHAADAMDGLEREFAAATVAINAVRPSDPTLARIHRPYARTYFFEDAYLSALVAGLAAGDVSDLPDTQAAQRRAIIEWRTRLEIAARDAGVRLPTDLEQAGRGEIAPSPEAEGGG
jgi:hypothetical protein